MKPELIEQVPLSGMKLAWDVPRPPGSKTCLPRLRAAARRLVGRTIALSSSSNG